MRLITPRSSLAYLLAPNPSVSSLSPNSSEKGLSRASTVVRNTSSTNGVLNRSATTASSGMTPSSRRDAPSRGMATKAKMLYGHEASTAFEVSVPGKHCAIDLVYSRSLPTMTRSMRNRIGDSDSHHPRRWIGLDKSRNAGSSSRTCSSKLC